MRWNLEVVATVLIIPAIAEHKYNIYLSTSDSNERERPVQHLEHDDQLRAAARAIYDAVYPGEEWTPVPFAEAEKFGTVHYRNAVAAAIMARAQLRGEHARQMVLI